MPTSWAITPPRSMSPASTTGTPAARAKPMLAMSPHAQIDLGRAARALDQDQVGLPREPGEARQHPAAGAAASARGSRGRCSCRSTRPCTTTWAPVSLCGLSRTGFMSTRGSTPQARACSACARPISPPSAVTAALLLMFCGLNGRTRRPAPGEGAAQAGHQQGLAGVRAGALDHQRAWPWRGSWPRARGRASLPAADLRYARGRMFAMVLDAPGQPLRPARSPDPVPGPGQVLVRVQACAVCRTDLHVVDGELPNPSCR